MRAWFALILCACKYDAPTGPADNPDGPSPDTDDGVLRVGFAAATSSHAEDAGVVDVVVRLSRPPTGTVVVNFSVQSSTARSALDFDLAPGSLTFDGTDEQTIQVTLHDNDQLEATDTIDLILDSPVGAELGTSAHVLSITDDDTCFGTGMYAVCPVAAPVDPVTLPPVFDTVTGPCADIPASWTAAGQPDACFVFGTTITVDTTRVIGTRPLVLAATDEIIVNTLLDAASHVLDQSRGPGSPGEASCANFSQTPGNNSSGAAGGAGATYRTKGGNGADGNGTNTEGRSNNPSPPPNVLHAGCDGQRGGDGDGVSGNPGRGGGAVYLTAQVLTIAGVLNASGSGAQEPANTKSGGSGGGSGGMIKLFAQAITATGAIIVANGGGGASGSGQNANDGNPGFDPIPILLLVAAPGGAQPGVTGGRGGDGSLAGDGENAPNNGGGENEGGGGGGGGAGRIESNLALTGVGVVSPGVTIAP